jgi:hypothetical protein
MHIEYKIPLAVTVCEAIHSTTIGHTNQLLSIYLGGEFRIETQDVESKVSISVYMALLVMLSGIPIND